MKRRLGNVGLTLAAGLLVATLGASIWLGATLPDPKSCFRETLDSLRQPGRADLKARARATCRYTRAHR